METKLKLKSTTFLAWLLVSLCFAGCEENARPAQTDTIAVELKVSTPLQAFLAHFQEVTLPCSFSLPCRDSLDFDSEMEIPRDSAIKYLLSGNRVLLKQPTGGIYQFYYAYRFPVKDHVIPIVYFRPSYNGYSGFVLSIIDTLGNVIDQKLIAGDSLESAQLEAIIQKNWRITLSEVRYKFDTVGRYDTLQAKLHTSHYSINAKGKIVENKPLSNKEVRVKVEDDCGYLRVLK